MKKFINLFLCIWIVSTAFAQNGIIHVIQRGETLESIAARCGTSPTVIKELNPLVDVYCTGMEILLPVQEQVSNKEYVSERPTTKKRGNSFFRSLGNAFLSAMGTMGNAYVQNNMYVTSPSPVPGYYPSMSMNKDWGSGYAGPMTYSNDPVLNATIGVAMSEQRLMDAGVTITGTSDFDRYKPTTLKGAGWISTPSTTSLGLDRPYVTCSNCGVSYQYGSGHLCKVK